MGATSLKEGGNVSPSTRGEKCASGTFLPLMGGVLTLPPSLREVAPIGRRKEFEVISSF